MGRAGPRRRHRLSTGTWWPEGRPAVAKPMPLLKRFEGLTDGQQQRLLEALDSEDVAGEVTGAYLS